MNSRMMISSVLGRSMSSLRSSSEGIVNRISVKTQRKTFSKLRLKICASMTSTTEVRSRMYTIVTERFSRKSARTASRREGFGFSMQAPYGSSRVKSFGSNSGRICRRGTRSSGS